MKAIIFSIIIILVGCMVSIYEITMQNRYVMELETKIATLETQIATGVYLGEEIANGERI